MVSYSREKRVTELIRSSLYAWNIYVQAVKRTSNKQWRKAQECLDDLYRLVGEENEYTGYTFACGWHPLQQWVQEEIRHHNRSRL